MIEAARAGDAGTEFARQAEKLRTLSRDIENDRNEVTGPLDSDELIQAFECRLERHASRQEAVAALADEIGANARQQTAALRLEDVESRVVVYSKHRARELRSLAAEIDARQQSLQAGIADSRRQTVARATTNGERLGTRLRDSDCGLNPVGQNSLDHDADEMF